MNLIQIGSGSASLDTNIQDGFSNYIISKNIKKKVFIIEANSIHILNLKKFYEKKKMLLFIILQLFLMIQI